MGYSEVIKAARLAKGWTQQKLADETGVQQPTVQRWEAGARAPEIEAVPRVAQALEVEPHLLADFDYGKYGLAPEQEITVAAEVAKFWPKLAPDDRTTIRDMAARLARK